jgi:hypothetical protein
MIHPALTGQPRRDSVCIPLPELLVKIDPCHTARMPVDTRPCDDIDMHRERNHAQPQHHEYRPNDLHPAQIRQKKEMASPPLKDQPFFNNTSYDPVQPISPPVG